MAFVVDTHIPLSETPGDKLKIVFSAPGPNKPELGVSLTASELLFR